MLRFVSALAFLSAIGMLVFASLQVVSSQSISAPEWQDAAYVAVLHFILPFSVFYSVSVNSPMSRYIIAAYVVIIFGATYAGIGYLASIDFDFGTRISLQAILTFLVLIWLFVSPKMRYYYAVLSGRPVPSDLLCREQELASHVSFSARNRAIIEWIVDHVEITVLLGFIILTFVAFAGMSP